MFESISCKLCCFRTGLCTKLCLSRWNKTQRLVLLKLAYAASKQCRKSGSLIIKGRRLREWNKTQCLGQQKLLEPACLFHALQVQLYQVQLLNVGAVNQQSTLCFGNSNDLCCFKAVSQIKKSALRAPECFRWSTHHSAVGYVYISIPIKLCGCHAVVGLPVPSQV